MKSNNVVKEILVFLISLILSAFILMMASSIFKGFYIESFWTAIVTALVIASLNALVKPALIYLTLPLTVGTLGLFYPVINVIILKLASVIMGNGFRIEGFLVPIIIALFISLMNLILNNLIIKPIVRGNRR